MNKSERPGEKAGTQARFVGLHQPHPVQEKPGTGLPLRAQSDHYATWFAAPGKHGPAGPVQFVSGRGWVRSCLCGAEFASQLWDHVPGFYDHLATKPKAEVSHE